MKALFSALHVTKKVAVLVMMAFILLLIVTMHLYWSFFDAGGNWTSSDSVGLIAISMIAIFAIGFTGWLAFSKSGRSLLAESAEYETPQFGFARFIRMLGASAGIATGLWLILIVISLVIGGPEWVSKMFLPWILVLLTVLCLPISYKWLK